MERMHFPKNDTSRQSDSDDGNVARCVDGRWEINLGPRSIAGVMFHLRGATEAAMKQVTEAITRDTFIHTGFRDAHFLLRNPSHWQDFDEWVRSLGTKVTSMKAYLIVDIM